RAPPALARADEDPRPHRVGATPDRRAHAHGALEGAALDDLVLEQLDVQRGRRAWLEVRAGVDQHLTDPVGAVLADVGGGPDHEPGVLVAPDGGRIRTQVA